MQYMGVVANPPGWLLQNENGYVDTLYNSEDLVNVYYYRLVSRDTHFTILDNPLGWFYLKKYVRSVKGWRIMPNTFGVKLYPKVLILPDGLDTSHIKRAVDRRPIPENIRIEGPYKVYELIDGEKVYFDLSTEKALDEKMKKILKN